MRKRFLFLALFLLCGVVAPSHHVFAAKQKYTRHYQKKKKFVQKKDSYFQEKDLPTAAAYLQVERKKPTVRIKYNPSQSVFKTKAGVVCNGKAALSCTSFAVSFSASADCETSDIELTVSETQKMTTLISSEYQKGTCFFDQIMKHELSHQAVFKKALNAFINKTAQDLILIYEDGQNASKSCKEIQKRVSEAAVTADKTFAKSAQNENAKLDTDQGEHAYRLDVCKQNE